MIKAHYEESTQKLLGWYDTDFHETIPTPNVEISQEEWQKAIDINANYVDIDTKVLSVMDFRTAGEISLDEINAKWDSLDIFLSTLTVTISNDRIVDVSPRSLLNIDNEINAMTDQDISTWHESWGSFEVNKVDLQEARILRKQAKDAKIIELGIGA